MACIHTYTEKTTHDLTIKIKPYNYAFAWIYENAYVPHSPHPHRHSHTKEKVK